MIVTSSLSKAYGLPGLRLGWLVSAADAVESFWTRHDYTTIGPSALSDRLAERVLRPENRVQLLARTRTRLRANWELVRAWLATRPDLWTVTPRAGAMAWLRCGDGVDSGALAEALRVEHGLLLVPGEHFGRPGWLRIGFGAPPRSLELGLARLGEALGEA